MTDLCVRHGSYACAYGVNVVPSAVAKVMADETSPVVAVSAGLIENENSVHPGKIAGTTQAANHVGAPTQPGRQTSNAPSRAALAAPPAMKYGPTFTQVIQTRAHASKACSRYSLHPLRDG